MTDDGPVAHAEHRLKAIGDEGQVVGDQDDRHRLIEAAQEGQHLAFDAGVQPHSGLIQDEETGLGDDGASNQGPLPLAPGEVRVRLGGAIREAHRFQGLHHQAAVVAAEGPEAPRHPQPAHEHHVTKGHGEPRVGGELLRHVSDLPAGFPRRSA